MRAERDMDVTVVNNETHRVGGSLTESVQQYRFVVVGGNAVTSVGGNTVDSVNGDATSAVSGNRNSAISADSSVAPGCGTSQATLRPRHKSSSSPPRPSCQGRCFN